jgi:hypothetical protein
MPSQRLADVLTQQQNAIFTVIALAFRPQLTETHLQLAQLAVGLADAKRQQ